MNITEAQEYAKEHGFDSLVFESINLQGKPMRFKWLDAYMGIFRFEGDKSFITVNQWKDVTDDLFQFMIAKDQTFQD